MEKAPATHPTRQAPALRPSLTLFAIAGTVAALHLTATGALAQPAPRLVADINKTPASSSPSWRVTIGDRTFFRATGGSYLDQELWTTDGTAGGTTRINVDPGDGSWPEFLTDVAGTLYFAARHGSYGEELWQSNGTQAGTVLVKDIVQGAESSEPENLTAVGETLFFTANDGTGRALWKSDGTEAGTVLVKNIGPGPAPDNLTDLAGTLFFSAWDGNASLSSHGLWKSDGTEAGTVLVKPGIGEPPSFFSRAPYGFTPFDDGLLFFAWDSVHLLELWRSDGTETGTVLVKDIHPSGNGVKGVPVFRRPGMWWGAILDGQLFFAADDGVNGTELWKTDGTEAGTVLVHDVLPGSGGSAPTDFVAGDGVVFFFADDGTNGRELWKTDGTTPGTSLVMDIYPGAGGQLNFATIGAVLNGSLIFRARVSGSGLGSLWRSDGTAAGTEQLLSLNVSNLQRRSGVHDPINIMGDLALFGVDGPEGRELWKTDGTAAGTSLVFDVNPTTEKSSRFQGNFITSIGDMVVFNANDGVHGDELWGSDGTEAGTVLLRDLEPGSGFGLDWFASQRDYAARVGNGAVFQAETGASGDEPWITDGTPEGTVLLRDIRPGPDSSGAHEFTPWDGLVFFTAQSGALWRTDGTTSGTFAVSGGIGAGDLALVGDELFFTAYVSNRRELWASAGTGATTRRVATLGEPGQTMYVYGFQQVGDAALFRVFDVGDYVQLWRTDGSEAGTGILMEVAYSKRKTPVDGTTSDPEAVAASHAGTIGDLYLFNIDDGVHGAELWRSDGTVEGTELLKDINPSGNSSPRDFFEVAGAVLFFADDGVHGRELWRTDGTQAGTQLVQDIRPGPVGSDGCCGFSAVVHDGSLYFQADDGVSGWEIWVSDGTADGTRLFGDIMPGSEGSNPWGMTLAGTTLYLFADHPQAGHELWAIELDATTPVLLSGFEASYDDEVVELRWQIGGDRGDVIGQKLERSGGGDVVEQWLAGDTRTYTDDTVEAGTRYTYRLTLIGAAGNELAASGEIEVQASPRHVFALGPNRPNPFKPATTIGFSLAEQGHARIRIFDVQGRMVRTLLDETRAAGPYSVVWDSRDTSGRAVAAGIYFYRLEAGEHTETRRMTLVR